MSAGETLTYKDAIARALHEAMAADPKVFVLGQDVGKFSIGGVTKGLIDEFGAARVRDCPISESAMVGIGAGAAMNGHTAVIEIAYADILAVAFSSIVHSTRAGLAERYLANDGYTMTDVSQLLGFTAPSAFSRWFHQHFGVSPSEWRAVSRA